MGQLAEVRRAVVAYMAAKLSCPVVSANQTMPHAPVYPYVSFSITTPAAANDGTWGVVANGDRQKPFQQTWSITAHSDTEDEAEDLAFNIFMLFDARSEVLENAGIRVLRRTSMTSRDNMLSIQYEFKKGLDVTFGFTTTLPETLVPKPDQVAYTIEWEDD